MSDLRQAVEQVWDYIVRPSKIEASINEGKNGVLLIQSILEAIGGDVADLDDVHTEHQEQVTNSIFYSTSPDNADLTFA